MEAPTGPRLCLEVDEQVVTFDPSLKTDSEARLCLGGSAANDLVCEQSFASREHAYIEYKNNDFYLVDCSTNGTVVQTEDNAVVHIHRDRLRLWGQGWIALGEAVTTSTCKIFFFQPQRANHAVD